MTLLIDLLQRKNGTASGFVDLAEFNKEELPEGFPVDLWNWQRERYDEYWRWFTGEVWDVVDPGTRTKDAKEILRYPLQINLIKTAILRQNYVLFGEVPDGPDPLVPTRVIVRKANMQDAKPIPIEDKARAAGVEGLINDVWVQNSGRTTQLESGLTQGILGGTVYRVGWDPDRIDDDFYGITLEMTLPDFFLPVWNSRMPDELLECFVVWRVPAREAELIYGFTAESSEEGNPLYIEHWTKDEVHITIGGMDVAVGDGDDEIVYAEGTPNPFGFIPFVYIPRERSGSYYGISAIDDLEGLTKEYNARMADIGDVIHETSHRQTYMRNVTGSPHVRDLGGVLKAVDIGNTRPGATDKPEVWSDEPPGLHEGFMSYPELLRRQIGRDGFIPPVSEGEDEGSQRSALTLAFRMWPITSKIRAIRSYWNVGLTQIAKMICKIAILKEIDVNSLGVMTKETMKGLSMYQSWSPMIPRDREQIVNEVILATQSEILSPLTGLEILHFVNDPADELQRVKDWLTFQATIVAAGVPAKPGNTPQPPKMMTEVPIAASGLDAK